MARIDYSSLFVESAALTNFCRDILCAQGVPPEDAGYVSWHLVETNLRGTDSHGVARLPHYVRRLTGGSIRAVPEIRFERKAASLGLVDGSDGLGHLVMRQATEKAAELAGETGAGWVAVNNSSHCGALAPFGLHLAERGMIGLVFSHVDPMVLPFGSAQPFCGTNPICLTAPGPDGSHLCLDMATSTVPWNLVANAAMEGVNIPLGWAVDANGEDTEDPRKVNALYPFGQHKGSGLGIVIDVMCSFLSGSPYGPDIPKMYGDMSQPRKLGGLVGAIRVDSFLDSGVFRGQMAELMRRLGDLPPAKGVDRVRYPGELELETKAERLKTGIPLGTQIFSELNELAATCGILPLQPVKP